MSPSDRLLVVPTRIRILTYVLLAIGAATLLTGSMAAPQRAWANLLLVSWYLVSLGIGAGFFLAVNYLAGASWPVAFRRVPEAFFAPLLAGAVGIAMVLLIRPSLYPWTRPGPELAARLIGFKGFWLQRTFFVARAAVYIIIWLLLVWGLVRNSRMQDRGPDPRYRVRNLRLSAAFMVAMATTYWLASFDWIMSLEPEWYSTIFGVYNFAGCLLASLAAIILLAVVLQRLGPLRDVLSQNHLHDLGKLLLAFSTFWMYIWFCQYMLIWYTNVPEETAYFARRQYGGWAPLLVLNLFLNWVIPFFVLLPRSAKRSEAVLLKAAIIVLLGRWLDLYIMIIPAVAGPGVPFGVWELGLACAAVGLFLCTFFRLFGGAASVPLHDPLLLDSLHYRS